jgi:uncharacterized membrane protein
MRYIEQKIVIGLGVFLLIMPLIGIPRSWKNFLVGLCGLALVYIGALLWKQVRTASLQNTSEMKTGTFTETV